MRLQLQIAFWMDRAQDLLSHFQAARLEDYNHVKLTNPYNWWVGTRYGEAGESDVSCVLIPPRSVVGGGLQSRECRREEAQSQENDVSLREHLR